MRKEGETKSSLWDSLVFKNAREILGAKQKTLMVALGQVDKDILDFLKIHLCCDIVETYGLAESCSINCMSYKGDSKSGHVGGPIANIKIKLRDVPDLYLKSSNNPHAGEILIWGPSVMPGYFRNPDLSSFAFDGQWLQSGDIGRIDPKTCQIQITDKLENAFIIGSKDVVQPQLIESHFLLCRRVNLVWVYGDCSREYCVMFVVLDPQKFRKWCQENGRKQDHTSLEDQTLREEIYCELISIADDKQLQAHEKPRQIKLLLQPFTIQNGLLTSTLKIKRKQAELHFRK